MWRPSFTINVNVKGFSSKKKCISALSNFTTSYDFPRCNKALCRFCLHEEMESFYCRSCLDVFSSNEAATFQNKCSRYLQCPNCMNVMSMMLTPGPNKTSVYFHYFVHQRIGTTTTASIVNMTQNKWI